jgi:tetratricopeptide (TPR) repeat protein
MKRSGGDRTRLAILLLLVAGAWAATPGAQPPSGDALSGPIPPGTLDPRYPVKPLDGVLRDLQQDRLAAPALERYGAGDYDAAARLGLRVLPQAPDRPGLRFAVANSLAWTGRYDGATEQYRELFGTVYDARARIGLANVLRWRGQADLAEPYYLEALAREPGHEEATQGLTLARRELRPTLTLRSTRTADNQDVRRDELLLSYRRWSDDRNWRFELGALGGRHRSPAGAWTPRGVLASAWATRLPLAPQIEAAYYDSDVRGARLFATLQIEPIRGHLRIRAGRVSWGRTAFSPGAAADDLSAGLLGLFAESDTGIGGLRGRLDYYDISDGNRVLDGEAQLTPAWQPLPGRLIWFGGLYAREAEREDPRYWSPRPAYALAFLGLRRDWSFERSDLNASVRRGFGRSSTAGDSWSVGVSGRHWLTNELAVGLEAWAVDTPRPGNYRMHHVGAFVQWLL